MARWKKGQSGNINGRPRGSRNKSSLIKAQLTLDDAMPAVMRMYVAIANRDGTALAEFGLTPKDITPKLMLEAGKVLVTQGASEMKALAAEQKKEGDKKPEPNQSTPPTFSTVASINKKTG